VICDNTAETTDAPNIEILRTVYGAENYAYIRNARELLLDLEDKSTSSGNTVFVQTLERIPIIMTRCGVLADYAIDGRNCILIDDENAEQLKAALDRMGDEDFRSEMSRFQKQDHAERYSMRAAARKFAAATRD